LLGGSPGSSTLGNALHFVNDVYQPPATRVPLIGYERVGPSR
jgi:hypothetical protein